MMDRESGKLTDKHFFDLPNLLQSGDVLVFNDSKVIPARLSAVIASEARQSKLRHFEVLLIKNVEGSIWECWVKPGKKAKVGDMFTFSGKLSAEMLRREEDIFFLKFNLEGSRFYSELTKIGEMPVPPYIIKARSLKNNKKQITNNKKLDKDGYQTIYARAEGSVAAPTAGLHFDEDLLEALNKKSVQLEYVTLHVGLGTFQPVATENVEDFQIHSEYYEISTETAKRLSTAKAEGRRIIAVGTTSVRVLESAAVVSGGSDLEQPGAGRRKVGPFEITPSSGDTSIYIYPGYKFKFVDGIITNFHLPKSSLLLLVSAFAGKENILNVYNYAVEKGYRFYSYGDGMVII